MTREQALEAALRNIQELNMTGQDENGHRWAHSDLIEQEIVAALAAAPDAGYRAGWMAGRDAAAADVDAKCERTCDYPDACRCYMAENIRALTPPAQWAPLPEGERERDYQCQITIPAKWMPCIFGGGWWIVENVDGGSALIGTDAPTAFAPLPPEGKA
jgi:hypothetical protein